MHRVTKRRLAGLLAALCVVEIFLIAASWRDRPAATATPSAHLPTAVPAAKAPAAGLDSAALGSFNAFVARPLFLAARRPAPAAVAAPAPSVPDPSARGVVFGPYKFTGIVMTPKVRIAFVTEIKSGRSITLAEGERLGDWRCVEITADSVALEKDGRRETIELHARR